MARRRDTLERDSPGGCPDRDPARAIQRHRLDDTDFEGTLVLEQLAAIDKVDDFFEAIDADDVGRATALMREADVDETTIAVVVRKIEESDGEH
jgi:hypothetical protein